MKILIERPPIWEEAHKHFTINDNATVYTYGDTLYNPANQPIDPALMAHEETHSWQQLAYPGGPAAWWKLYFDDPSFRVDQEIEAYREQYEAFCGHNKNRDARVRFALRLANDIASGMYGKPITSGEAFRKIRSIE